MACSSTHNILEEAFSRIRLAPVVHSQFIAPLFSPSSRISGAKNAIGVNPPLWLIDLSLATGSPEGARSIELDLPAMLTVGRGRSRRQSKALGTGSSPGLWRRFAMTGRPLTLAARALLSRDEAMQQQLTRWQ